MKFKKRIQTKLNEIIKQIRYITKSEISAYKPIEKLSVVDWCESNMFLDKKTTEYPGLYKANRTPFVIDIMNLYENPVVEEMILMFASQVSKTVMMIGMCLESLAQAEGPHLWVHDTEDKAIKKISKLRFMPTFDYCKVLKDNQILDGGKQGLKHFNFTRSALSFVGANSPGQLSSDSIKRIFADEIDKYPKEFTDEAGAVSLLRSRVKAFLNDSKIVLASTPTTVKGNIYSEFMKCKYQYFYFVPCPECSEMQMLEDSQLRTYGNIEYSPETEEEIIKKTYYECKKCKFEIKERHKMQMLRGGKWMTKDGEELKPNRRMAFQLSSLYSPFVKMGKYNLVRLESENDTLLLINFLNSWAGWPFTERTLSIDNNSLLNRLSLYKKGIVPKQARFVVGAVDCQENHYWGMRVAFGFRYKSWIIDYNKTTSIKDMDDYMRSDMLSHDGKKIYKVKKIAMDAGYKPDDVFIWCLQPENKDLWLPTIGARTENAKNIDVNSYIHDKFTNNKIKKLKIMRGVVNTSRYKESIFERLSRMPNTKGSLNIYRYPEKELCDQIASEEKQEQRIKNRVSVWKWVQTGTHNHLLDCLVYSFALAEHLGIYRLNPSEEYEKYENENMYEKEDAKTGLSEELKKIIEIQKEEIKPIRKKKKFSSSKRFTR
ncbi:MAG: terminase gpA endonuclease subunit [Patescibacteria group bacterium]